MGMRRQLASARNTAAPRSSLSRVGGGGASARSRRSHESSGSTCGQPGKNSATSGLKRELGSLLRVLVGGSGLSQRRLRSAGLSWIRLLNRWHTRCAQSRSSPGGRARTTSSGSGWVGTCVCADLGAGFFHGPSGARLQASILHFARV